MSARRAAGSTVVRFPTLAEKARSPADQLATVLDAVRGHASALGVVERPHKRYGNQYRFRCPVCDGPEAAVVYASDRRAVLYCDAKCGADAIVEQLGLDWQQITGQQDQVAGDDGRPRVDITNEVDAVQRLVSLICSGQLPELYTRAGELVAVRDVPAAGAAPVVSIEPVTEHRLRAMLVDHAVTYQVSADGRKPALPGVVTTRTILARPQWPGVPVLRGVVHTPVLRPDGSLLQEPGHDPATGYYLRQSAKAHDVPEVPGQEKIDEAFALLLGHLLIDFPWVEEADLANFLGLLITPVLRPYIGGLVPLGVITAPERGSGKSLLSEIVRQVYGADVRAWPESDEEARKSITAALRQTRTAIVFDNVPAHAVVDHASFAALLTMPEWTDRLLGQSRSISLVNDRLWLLNGTNVRLGGDLGQRSVLVRIDPKQPRPDLRTGFAIPDMEGYLAGHAHEALGALLILARSWALAGAPTIATPMRGYTRWASAIAGLLRFHGIEGFLGNRAAIDVHDEDAELWTPLLAAWWERHGDKPMRLADVLPEDTWPVVGDVEWHELFPKARNGRLPSVKALGAMLRERDGRFYGVHAVRQVVTATKATRWAACLYSPGANPGHQGHQGHQGHNRSPPRVNPPPLPGGTRDDEAGAR